MAKANQEEKIQETKYPLNELLENSKALFNYQKEVVIGALYGRTEKVFSVLEVKQAIDEFLNREVK